MKSTEDKREYEKRVVTQMIEIYCKKNHGGKPLCDECAELAAYANERTDKCPFMEEKTFCSNCKVHCYRPAEKEKIKEIMRFSGPRMLFHYPIAAIRHMILFRQEKKRLANEQ